ncbi:hypothetical protein EXIGUO8H_230002 [Exiguobacterium sp. 8H]|uniref:ASCH/PUA domain-containing protein n=2 Tax=unclassified Exiguobacterium TaxID=2644629 RepID=UPI0012F27997|nr:ASCH/PUA domain-containing protein [Exiguobacterium sp. 8A]VXB81024.1 hypothetical protein EXIGUO8H_230002 [Exiguobacterium sp. 8H]VXB97281.1 hypothetical protein EXIGUO8A_390005 [Exiguobacterium sp. 8A]
MVHELKIWPEYFDAVEAGLKTFEIRQDDRGYKSGDVLTLREYDPTEQAYTGRALCRRVTYTSTFAQRAGYVVMALGNIDRSRVNVRTEQTIP